MQARLTYRESPDGELMVFSLPRDRPTRIGRSAHKSELVLLPEVVSREHAIIKPLADDWYIANLSRNFTHVNDERIEVDAEFRLFHGDLIQIGPVQLRFESNAPGDAHSTNNTSEQMALPTMVERALAAEQPLQGDGLRAACQFMARVAEIADERTLVDCALQTIAQHTRADLVGFLSLDENAPVVKLVHVHNQHGQQINRDLSRQMTQRVRQEKKAVWLCQSLANRHDIESICQFTDALCVPLKVRGHAIGALHAYRSDSQFRESDLQYCEVLAGALANGLHALRSHFGLEAENARLRGPSGTELIGDSLAMRRVREQIQRFARSNSTVLIEGETGTGKELVAHALHHQSPRLHTGRYFPLNCAAIAPDLFESQLFGHRKNSFTGADKDRVGYFQAADEGTLFLDEIGDLELGLQAKFLRALEEKAYTPIGETLERHSNCRIVAATNIDLLERLSAGKFRQDLYYRLKHLSLRLPPLRERLEDVPQLAHYFLASFNVELNKQLSISEVAIARLAQYHWPGNVRQLRSVIECACNCVEVGCIEAGDLNLPNDAPEKFSMAGMPLKLATLEALAIREAMRRANDVKTEAAKLLGIGRDTLAKKWADLEGA